MTNQKNDTKDWDVTEMKKESDKSCHHDHEGCGHDHHHHDHEGCGHDHHHHDHEGCGHDHHHHSIANATRHVFSDAETKHYESLSLDDLMAEADLFLSEDAYGKVVPIFEIVLSKQLQIKKQDEETISDLMNTKQNLAFTYGIIQEHEKSIPLWKSVIEYKENNIEDVSDLLDDYFGLALSCEQCKLDTEFLTYINKGLVLAKNHQFPEYEATFEHELGGFYCDVSDFQNAEKHLLKAIQIRNNMNDIVGLTTSKMYLGILFEEQKNFEKAKTCFEEALSLSKTEQVSEELQGERAEIELRLSNIQKLNLKNKLLDF